MMQTSIDMITSYKLHIYDVNDIPKIDVMIKLYKSYKIPSRRTIINICDLLTSKDKRKSNKGRRDYDKLILKSDKRNNIKLYNLSDDQEIKVIEIYSMSDDMETEAFTYDSCDYDW